MTLLASVAVLAALGLLGVPSAAGEESVHQAFQRGANLFPEVQIEFLESGTLKDEFIAAISKFLALLDDDIERLFAWGVRELVQEATTREHDIENILVSLPSDEGSDILDYELKHMTSIYREVREIQEGSGLYPCGLAPGRPAAGSPRSHAPSLRKMLTRQRVSHAQEQQGGRAVYSLKELCNDLYGTMVRPDLATLHTWLGRVLGEGERTVQAASLTVQHQKAQKHLPNLAGSIRAIALNLKRHDAVLEAYTSPDVWAEYVYERNHLILC